MTVNQVNESDHQSFSRATSGVLFAHFEIPAYGCARVEAQENLAQYQIHPT